MLWKQPKQLLKQQAALQQFLSTNFQVLSSMQSLILKKLLLIICLKISSAGMPSKFMEEIMGDFTIEDMLAIQQALQEKYKDKWEPIGPEAGKHKLLWMLGEVGEVIDIIKKNGDQKAVEDAEVRQHFVEEMADVLMYYNDVLLCYGISEQELKEAYTAKFKKNMTRW